MTFMWGAATSAEAGNQSQTRTAAAAKPRVILVEVTGSRIPQRVVVGGQQVNSSSPLYVVRDNEVARTGATSVYGMIAMDPSVGIIRRSR